MTDLPYVPIAKEQADWHGHVRGFRPLGRNLRTGHFQWPVDEFIDRVVMTDRLASKLRRMNPHGQSEGELPLGWPKSRRVRYKWDQ